MASLLQGDGMVKTQATRRSFIGSATAGAALLGPLAVLAGCSGGGSTASAGAGLLSLFGAEPISSAKTETQIWQDAVGEPFRIGGATGPLYASLASVTPQPSFGPRPDDLRQQSLVLSFVLDRGYDTTGDAIYFLDRTMGTEPRLFMQRGTDANGRAELVALLN